MRPLAFVAALVTFIALFAGCSRLQPLAQPGSNANFLFASPSPTVPLTSGLPLESLADAVKKQLAEKYNKKLDDVTVTVTQELAQHAKGSVSFANEPGGGLWLAAREKGGWLLVADGQGPVACDKANDYGFPASLIPECLQDGKLIKR